jgi:hypothetical protein
MLMFRRPDTPGRRGTKAGLPRRHPGLAEGVPGAGRQDGAARRHQQKPGDEPDHGQSDRHGVPLVALHLAVGKKG